MILEMKLKLPLNDMQQQSINQQFIMFLIIGYIVRIMLGDLHRESFQEIYLIMFSSSDNLFLSSNQSSQTIITRIISALNICMNDIYNSIVS